MTYSDSTSAQKAVLNGPKGPKGLRVSVADAWNDGTSLIIAHDDDIWLSRLDENCLLKIFKYLNFGTLEALSRVCSRFNDIINRHIFSLQRKVNVLYGGELFHGDSKESFWNVLGSVLRHAREVKLTVLSFPDDIENISNAFTYNLGENLERLEIFQVFISGRFYEGLKKVFVRLKVFKWVCSLGFNNDYELDLVNWCPALKKLSLQGRMAFHVNAEKWKSLESASLNVLDKEHQNYSKFVLNNRQLKRLKIAIWEELSLMRVICAHLPNLETLKVDADDIVWEHFRGLGRLKHLKTLQLSFC